MQLHRDREEFDAAGVRLVVIGQGEPSDGRHFVRSRGLEGLPLLVDTERESYAAAGTKVATMNELLGPVVVAKGIVRALRSGQQQGRTVGHNAQLGGVLVVDTDSAITYSHLAEDASDTPPNSEVLEAARKTASNG